MCIKRQNEMTNSAYKTASKTAERYYYGASIKKSLPRMASSSYFNSIATPPRHQRGSHQHQEQRAFGMTLPLSPSFSDGKVLSHSPPTRTSPGLLAGHFAGCKWSEPPSPSALPKPPQHWTHSGIKCSSMPSLLCNPSQQHHYQQQSVIVKQPNQLLLDAQA